MKTVRTLDIRLNAPSVVALGCFDGLHKGHRALISEARRAADALGLRLVVFSFTAPPKSFFSQQRVPLLTTQKEKERLMRLFGVDILVSVDFSADIAALTPEEFFSEILLSRLCAASVFCGFNYRFGNKASGDAELLRELCKKNRIGFSAIPPVLVDGKAVSSSEIRRLLALGKVSDAKNLLGRNYSLCSAVVSGQQLGRTLGFPTVNQLIDANSAPLRRGVYVTRTRVGRTLKRSVTNLGTRPTVDGGTLCAETNLFDFEGDLYGRSIRVEFIEFIRPERKFDSVEELSAQVQKDIETAKGYK